MRIISCGIEWNENMMSECNASDWYPIRGNILPTSITNSNIRRNCARIHICISTNTLTQMQHEFWISVFHIIIIIIIYYYCAQSFVLHLHLQTDTHSVIRRAVLEVAAMLAAVAMATAIFTIHISSNKNRTHIIMIIIINKTFTKRVYRL